MAVRVSKGEYILLATTRSRSAVTAVRASRCVEELGFDALDTGVAEIRRDIGAVHLDDLPGAKLLVTNMVPDIEQLRCAADVLKERRLRRRIGIERRGGVAARRH